MKKLVIITALTITVISAGFAQRPVRDVGKRKHPNLAAAQRLSNQAYTRILDAQKANEWDLGGHAQKAKELLDQVNTELKLAAEAANRK
ncbi:MAG TPA: hypothetical protein VKT77_15455 [Chthonomonadaceae bacterium]|nr:hypothetical protein [Chthonomonadaceae bacterium]